MEENYLSKTKENNINEYLINQEIENKQKNQDAINSKIVSSQYTVEAKLDLTTNKIIIPTEPYYHFVPIIILISLILILFCSIPFIQLFWPFIFFHIFNHFFYNFLLQKNIQKIRNNKR